MGVKCKYSILYIFKTKKYNVMYVYLRIMLTKHFFMFISFLNINIKN